MENYLISAGAFADSKFNYKFWGGAGNFLSTYQHGHLTSNETSTIMLA